MSKQLTGPSGIPVPKIKAESETQTSTQVKSTPGRTSSLRESYIDENKIAQDQNFNASVSRRRRNISKGRQVIKQREKTPEPSKASIPHEDTTTTDEDDSRNSREIEADDIYEEMRRMVQKKTGEKDDDDIDIEELREHRKRDEQDRRRRSISPYSKPSSEELERLQRRSSFIDPDSKLLGVIPIYTLGPKGENENLSRKDSLVIEHGVERSNSLSVPSSPSTPGSPRQEQKFPFPLSNSPEKSRDLEERNKKYRPVTKEYTPSLTPSPVTTKKSEEKKKQIPAQTKIPQKKTESKEQNNALPIKVANEGRLYDDSDPKVPPIKPTRSKSGTRSDGKTSESEVSGEKRMTQTNTHQPRAPKPKERRKTMAAIKRNAREISNQKRSQSANRANIESSHTKVDMSKTSADIIDLLQKASRRSLSIPKENIISMDDRDKEGRKLITPCRTPDTPRSRYLRSPKTIQLINAKDILESMTTAQRLELEMERSRRSSGYIEASQSEYTTSCYSSSYSDDESDFDLSKKTAELNRKLTELCLENEELKSVVRRRLKLDGRLNEKDDDETIQPPKVEEKPKPLKKPDQPPKTKIGRFFYILRHLWSHWNDFKDENRVQYNKICLLRNRYAEGSFENMYKCNSKRVKRDFIDTLWQGVHRLNEDDWKSMARRKLWEFENQLHSAHEAGVRSNSGQNSWNFMNSVVYCLTVITTIGYGHIAPSTTAGRIATIVYAIIGIPMFLILLADFGKLFTRGMKYLWAFVRRLYYTGSCKKVRRTVPMQEVMKGFNMMVDAVRRPSQMVSDPEVGQVPVDVPPQLPPKPGSPNRNRLTIPNITKNDDNSSISEPQTPAPSLFEIDDEFNLPISVAFTMLVAYIFVGAIIYNTWERWGFFESFYFVFISMSTIGFGDYVPNHPMYMMGSIVYLIFGLALTSMCINVVQVKLSDSFRHASAKIGATIGLKVLEEDGSLVPVTPPLVEIAEVHGASKAKERDGNSENSESTCIDKELKS